MGYKEIGRKIQKAREEAGLNQEELAARIGLSQATLSNYELGKPLQYFLEENDRPTGSPGRSEDDGRPGGEAKACAEGKAADEGKAGGEEQDLREIVKLAKNLTPGEKKQVIDYLKFLMWQKREGK